MITTTLPKQMPKTYSELSELLMPRPIRDNEELSSATEMIDRLAGHDLNDDQDDYLEALSIFVEDYEEKHYPINDSHITPLNSLKFLLKENGLIGSDLGRILGSRTLGSAILRGERQLSKVHIKRLAEYFSVDASIFLR